jgi:ABC-type dipeptide/oligopeptide/nickel transport system permease subunit
MRGSRFRSLVDADIPRHGLVLTTLSFNLVGDGLRDAMDPRMGG